MDASIFHRVFKYLGCCFDCYLSFVTVTCEPGALILWHKSPFRKRQIHLAVGRNLALEFLHGGNTEHPGQLAWRRERLYRGERVGVRRPSSCCAMNQEELFHPRSIVNSQSP